ncbi:MAG TPA: low temperature requirement protein A [Solirubrobacterales bacterium]
MATGTSEAEGPARARRLTAALRSEERVTPLELFFDLVFVLALTQCTALMSEEPTFEGLLKGLLALGVLWWAWVGYAWLTSVIDPEEGAVRLVIFGAMAGFLVAALAVPQAFGDEGLVFALAYGAVRFAQLGLFWIASDEQPELRHSLVIGLVGSTAVGVGLLVGASFLDGWARIAVWALALGLDMAGPLFFGSEGWRLAPRHFAERHGLIVIIALGESIVAIGAGVEGGLDAGVIAAAVLGMVIAAGIWWTYFDVVALVAARRLERAEAGKAQNEMARDSYSFLHLPMVAGIVLVALGMKKTLGHVDDPLDDAPALALLGGLAIYLLAHVAFRWRNVRTLNRQRLGLALLLFALFPLAVEVPSLAIVATCAVLLVALIAYETRRYGEARARVRHGSFTPEAR